MMKVLLVLLIAICAVNAGPRLIISKEVNPVSNRMINLINIMNTTWKAARNFRRDTPLSFLKGLCGVLKDNNKYRLPTKFNKVPKDLPSFFDGREQWPNCPSLREVRDQGSCGSCWVFGAVTSMTDRYCIASNGKVNVHVSAEDLMTCCPSCGDGCKGGYPGTAWEFWVNSGLVTGGQYNTNQGCQPYAIAGCEHHIKGKLRPCKNIDPTPKCVHMCEKSFNSSYLGDKHFGSKSYSIPQNIKQIQTEIMNHGPVEASFSVYGDFPWYKSGVYIQHSEQFLGGHAVRVLGWGTENEVDYWLVANSWNPEWGNKGYFKIRRGTNECGIEEDIVAGLPKLT